MKLVHITGSYSVCKISECSAATFVGEFVSLSKTAQEISLVCETQYAPAQTLYAEHGWSMLKVDGQLDFGMVGVIAELSAVLAKASVPIFVISTYDTDYLLVKTDAYEKATAALSHAGHHIEA